MGNNLILATSQTRNTTTMNDQLKLTIASGVVHGLKIYDEVSKKAYNLSDCWNEPLPDEFHHKFGKTFIEQCLHDPKLKPMMHPTSKLTEPILPDGKIPIVELAKIAFKSLNLEGCFDRVEINGTFFTAYFKNKNKYSLCFSFCSHDNSFCAFYKRESKTIPNQLALFDQLDAWHINYRGVEAVEIETSTNQPHGTNI